MMYTEPETPTDALSAQILYCPACGGAISLENIPIEAVIEGVKSAKPMPVTEENFTVSPDSTTLEDYYV